MLGRSGGTRMGRGSGTKGVGKGVSNMTLPPRRPTHLP